VWYRGRGENGKCHRVLLGRRSSLNGLLVQRDTQRERLEKKGIRMWLSSPQGKRKRGAGKEQGLVAGYPELP